MLFTVYVHANFVNPTLYKIEVNGLMKTRRVAIWDLFLAQ